MCPFLGLFVVGHVMIGPDLHLIQTLEDKVIEEYVVVDEDYQKCLLDVTASIVSSTPVPRVYC